MEDDPDRVTRPGSNATDTVAKIHSVCAARALDGAVMYGECHRVSLAKWHYFRARLHPWALLSQHKLAAREIPPRFRKKKRDLDWKDILAIKILVETVVVVNTVLQEQRSRSELPRLVAARDEVGMLAGITHFDPHRFIPAIGDRNQMRIDP